MGRLPDRPAWKRKKSLDGVVDKDMEQSVNAVELVGFLNAMAEAEPGCTFVTDCASIYQHSLAEESRDYAARRPHGNIWREASNLLHSGKGPTHVQKCKAHKCIEGREKEDRCIALGNDAADKNAKTAVEENNLRGDNRAEVISDSTWVQKVAAELERQYAT